MKRRKFITLLGGMAATWPIAARAQHPAMPVIGFFHLTSLELTRELLAAFHLGLGDTGYIEGRNVAVEYRWAQGQNDRLPTLIAELVRRQVSVIVILESTHGALSAKAATKTIPIVCMQAADPVQIGLIDSFNRPGGNLTGIHLMLAETVGKRLERLLELVSAAKTIAYLRNPTAAVFSENETRELHAAARERGIRLLVVNASRPSEFETAFADLVHQRADGARGEQRRFSSYRSRSNRRAGGPPCRASDLRLAPVHGSGRSHELWNELFCCLAASRCLHRPDSQRRKACRLPVVQPTKFELVINLKTAKALGLTVPLTLQVASDEVIE